MRAVEIQERLARGCDLRLTPISMMREAGAPVEPQRFTPVMEGLLLTGGKPLHLRAEITEGGLSELTEVLRGSHIPKIAARYLTSHLPEHVSAMGDVVVGGRSSSTGGHG